MNHMDVIENRNYFVWPSDAYDVSNTTTSTGNATDAPTNAPTVIDAEEIHDTDAYEALFLNVTLIGCVLFAYYVKVNKIYSIPERLVACPQ